MSTTITEQDIRRWRRDPPRFALDALHDPETGRPFTLYAEEVAFLRCALTLTSEGRLPYTELLFSAPKKSGKSMLGAIAMVYVIVVLAGRFGEGICVANDYDQAAGRVFAACARLIEASPLLAGEAKVTADKITFPSLGSTIVAIPADYASAAGSNPNFVCFDELWAFTSERANRLWDELTPPPTRRATARLVVSYAGYTSESILLEGLVKRGLNGELVGTDLRAQKGMLAYVTHECRAPWQTPEWLAEMKATLRPAAYTRMIENQFTSTDSTFVDMAAWDACVHPDLRPVMSDQSLPIFVGVDASTKRDQTAIVATTWDRKAKVVRLVFHRAFQPTPGDPLNFEATIERTVMELRDRFRLRKLRFDPWQLAAVSQRLAAAGIKVEEFAQTASNLTAMGSNLFELISGHSLVTYPDAALRLAISRTIAVETARGLRLAKEKTSHKIDLAVALAMSAHAAVESQSESQYDSSLSWVSDASDRRTWRNERGTLMGSMRNTFPILGPRW